MTTVSIKNLSLLELFYTCVSNLAKIMVQCEITLPEEQYSYSDRDDYDCCIYHKREIDAARQTMVVMHDTEKLIELCGKTGDLDDTSEYRLLIHFLKERTIIRQAALKKEGVERPFEVLLNSSDPEAFFR